MTLRRDSVVRSSEPCPRAANAPAREMANPQGVIWLIDFCPVYRMYGHRWLVWMDLRAVQSGNASVISKAVVSREFRRIRTLRSVRGQDSHVAAGHRYETLSPPG